MARRVEEEERTRRDAPKFLLHKPIHPTPHHLLFRYMERKTGGEGPARSCRCIFFFFFFFFNVLSGDYNIALADIYISLHLLVLLRFNLFISSHRRLYLSLLFTFFLGGSSRADWPQYVTPYTVCFFCPATPLRSAIPPARTHTIVYSSWPLYQQPLPFTRTSPRSRPFLASSSDCNVNS